MSTSSKDRRQGLSDAIYLIRHNTTVRIMENGTRRSKIDIACAMPHLDEARLKPIPLLGPPLLVKALL